MSSLVHICEQLGCARRLAILAAEVYFAYDFMHNFGLKSCEPRAMGAHFVQGAHFVHQFCAEKLRFSNFKLELRQCTSSATLVLQIAILQAGALECSSRTTFVLKTCELPAGVEGMSSANYFCT